MHEVSEQSVDRNLAKKIFMQLARNKNSVLSSLKGTSVGMNEMVTSFTGPLNTHHDIYKLLFHKAIDTQKVHTGKQVVKHVFNFVAAAAGGNSTPLD